MQPLSSIVLLCCLQILVFAIDHIDLDDDCIDLFSKNSHDLDAESYLSHAMKKGYWNCAKQIVFKSQNSSSSIDFRSIFDSEHRSILRDIAGLKSVIESSLPMPNVSPAFQWAQSSTEILLNVKFSHKIDAPATLNVEANNVTILDNRLILHASDGRKNFNLDLLFLKEIVPDESRYDMGSVGRMTFNLKKKINPSKWNRLLLQRGKKVAHMHMWWEMQEKYNKELEKLDDDDDDDGAENRAKKSEKINKLKPDKKKKIGDDDIGSGSILSPEAQALAESTKKIDDDAKAKIKAVEENAKKLKDDVDAKAKEDKRTIEFETLAKRREIEKEADAAKASLKGAKAEL